MAAGGDSHALPVRRRRSWSPRSPTGGSSRRRRSSRRHRRPAARSTIAARTPTSSPPSPPAPTARACWSASPPRPTTSSSRGHRQALAQARRLDRRQRRVRRRDGRRRQRGPSDHRRRRTIRRAGTAYVQDRGVARRLAHRPDRRCAPNDHPRSRMKRLPTARASPLPSLCQPRTPWAGRGRGRDLTLAARRAPCRCDRLRDRHPARL